ncbi:MAG TPA: rubrerythrin family protein [Thermoplasmatales archaeon]|nr:rubrerythrin family protein [Thermoplasmatales archaeon]
MREEELKKLVMEFQKNEITEHLFYDILSKKAKGKNSEVLGKISRDELRHYMEWKKITGKEVKPNRLKLWKFIILSKIFGITFAVKLMEKGEERAEEAYKKLIDYIPKAKEILQDETEHEEMLVSMIEEEKLNYIGSMVLGLNDALVELMGALAGLTFALQNTILIGTAGLITGIAASLSMASSEYLSKKSEGEKNPGKASFYTGIAYIFTVLFLVFPYFILKNYYLALLATIFDAFIVILLFTFFVAVIKDKVFHKLFLEMMGISLGIAAISFAIGWIVRSVLGIEI